MKHFGENSLKPLRLSAFAVKQPVPRGPDDPAVSGSPKIYIVVLNFNRGADTAECLESLLRSDYPRFQVLVVDNCSSDGSMQQLREWAEGRREYQPPGDHPLRRLSFPPVPKPVSHALLSAPEVEENAPPRPERVIFIQSDRNRGFAGGNNLGIRFALRQNDFEYLWILNNDTVVAPDAPGKLVETMRRYRTEGQKIGILGSKLLYYDAPEIIQALGGRYRKWLGVGRHVGDGERDRGQYDRLDSRPDYAVGAAMLVSREFLGEVGLLSEDYFLYFEELDWALRARQQGWEVGVCGESKVYHKEGRTIGSHADLRRRSYQSDYYMLKNRLVFTRKFYPRCLPAIWASYAVSLARGLLFGRRERVKVVLRILKEEWR